MIKQTAVSLNWPTLTAGNIPTYKLYHRQRARVERDAYHRMRLFCFM